MWKVQKDSNGYFIALARSISCGIFCDLEGEFLFELLAEPSPSPPKGYQINNKYISHSNIFSSFSAVIVFQKPSDSYTSFGDRGKNLTAVYLVGSYNQDFGTFSGKDSFDGALEILNDNGTVLLETTKRFKGWER